MSILWYKRPDYIAKVPGPMSLTQCQIYVERTHKHKKSIPPELSFENVIQNKALPPCSLQDFMDYLVYVSHDAENLQFWVWLDDYSRRFYEAPRGDQALSPPWYLIEQPAAMPTGMEPQGDKPWQPPPMVAELKKQKSSYDIDFDNLQPPKPPTSSHSSSPRFEKQSFLSGKTGTTVTNVSNVSTAETVHNANAQVGLKWQSFDVQPFRSEIDRVISHYLAQDSPRELNLSHRNRTAVLHALQHTTHPSALSLVKDMVEATLRGQSHPNFIRWAICNGNRPRVVFVKTNGYLHVAAGFIVGILLVLSHAARWWRFFCFPLFFIGCDIGVAAYKGLCVIIHTNHHRALRPWEQFSDGASVSSFEGAVHDEAALSTDDVFSMHNRSSKGASMDTFGTSNAFDHELWVDKYAKQPVIKKVFAKSLWVQNETIRLLQDKIVMQSHVWALLISVPLTAFMLALPVTNII